MGRHYQKCPGFVPGLLLNPGFVVELRGRFGRLLNSLILCLARLILAFVPPFPKGAPMAKSKFCLVLKDLSEILLEAGMLLIDDLQVFCGDRILLKHIH